MRFSAWKMPAIVVTVAEVTSHIVSTLSSRRAAGPGGVLRAAEGEAQQRALLRRRRRPGWRAASAAAPSRRTCSVTGSVARQPGPSVAHLWVAICLAIDAVLVAQVVAARACLPSIATSSSPGFRTAAAGEPGVHGGHARGRLLGAVGPVDAGQQRERDEDVDRRPGADHDDPLPDGLAVVGAVLDLRRDLLRRVHAGDLHVAAERDRADRVLRLAAPRLRPQRREEQREALDAHPDRLGGREVAELVQHDQGREAQERQQPAHAASAPTSSAATARASPSAR